MNGVHDMGGMHGMGPVEIEKNEPVFHAEWESRVFALMVATAFLRKWNIDMGRHSRERMPPATVSRRDLLRALALRPAHAAGRGGAGEPQGSWKPDAPNRRRTVRVRSAPQDVANYLRHRVRARVDADVPPKFKPGDRVVARNIHPVGHTRLPRYARARHGTIDRDHGVFIFPDTHAMSRDKKPQHLYSVRFAARELWGPRPPPRDGVYLNLWDDYLDAA